MKRILLSLLFVALAGHYASAQTPPTCPPAYFAGSSTIAPSTCGMVVYNGSGAGTLTLPSSPWTGSVLDQGPGVATLQGNGGAQINGASTLVMTVGQGGIVSGIPSLGWYFAGSTNTGGGMTTSGSNATSAALGNIGGAASGTANYVFATPNGSPGAYSGRALVAADIPNLSTSDITGTTNGTVPASAGYLGELITAECASVASQTATFTDDSANITLATNAIPVGCPLSFTTSNTLPTNFSTSTNYYVLTLSTLTITVATAPGGTAITAGSAGVGTQSAVGTGALLSSGSGRNVAGVALTAGGWLCYYQENVTPSSTMTVLKRGLSQSTATLPAVTDPSYFATAASLTSADVEANSGMVPELLSSGAEVYLVNEDTFASTATALGNIICQRFY